MCIGNLSHLATYNVALVAASLSIGWSDHAKTQKISHEVLPPHGIRSFGASVGA